MVERSQKEVWRLTPWLMIALLIGNFVLMAWHAKTDNNQSFIRVWTGTLANFFQTPLTTVTSSISESFNRYVTLRTAQDENDQLKQKIQELEVEVQRKQDLAAENERLKGILQLKQENKYQILPARVIGRDPSNWFNDSIINRGTADGVKLYMPIVSNGGLIGRVTAVSPVTAQITLITDERSGVGAVIGETGNPNTLGVVNGVKDKGILEMRYVPGTVEVKEGDFVFTSGQDGIYPPGLKIGEIIEVRTGSSNISHIIHINPSSGISSMKEVAVLLYEAPPRPKFEQSVPNSVKDEKDKAKKPAQ